MDEEEKKLFFKEVALLDSIKHQSVVKSMAVCYQPLAMMLKYVYFDFHLFGQAVRVNTLSEFLLKIDEKNCGGFHDLIYHAATEVIDGMGYLHNQRIAHRDLKTANILVSNQHYSSLSLEDEELGPLIKQDRLPVSWLTLVKVVPTLFKRRQLSPRKPLTSIVGQWSTWHQNFLWKRSSSRVHPSTI